MIRRFAALAAAVAVLVGACSGSGPSPVATTALSSSGAATPNGGPVTVTDALGRQVSFASPPSRIAIVGKAAFVVADAVYLFPEASSRVVALANMVQNRLAFIPVIDPTYSSKTILSDSAGAEQIASSNPDVVLMKSGNADTLGKPLEAIGIKVVFLDFETPDQYTRDLETVGQLLGDHARAQHLISFFEAQTSRVTTALTGLPDSQKPSVLLLYYSNKNGTVAFNVPPLSYIQSTEVQLAGGQPVWKDAQLGSGWTTVNLEQIAAWNPDQIYVVAYSGKTGDVVAGLRASPDWQALRAVKQNAIYAFPGDYFSWDQPDPRWVLGLTWLATKIHPGRFPGLSMDQEIRGFYRDLYGVDSTAYARDIEPRISGDLP